MKPLSFEELMLLQKQLNHHMGFPMGEETGDINLVIKNNMLALIKEATEVLDEVNWKPWKSKAKYKTIDRDKLHEELIDCLQFLVNALNMVMSPSEVTKTYYQKLEICHQRILDNKVTKRDD